MRKQRPSKRKTWCVVALVSALSTAMPLTAAAAQESQTPSAVDDEIIVRGRGYGELRARIRLAQEAVFARFNEINSDDDFDIRCTMESRAGTRVRERACLSNSWREQEANMAEAVLGQLAGRSGLPAAVFRAEQLRMQRLLHEEMRRLAFEDAALGEAVMELGREMQALQTRIGGAPKWTMFRAVAAGENGLPYDAERAFEVQMGLAPWTHYLTERTFTIGQVSGTVRKIAVDCEQNDFALDYEPDVEWTIPPDWDGCMLRVRAKRGTTFALYEFQAP